MIRLKKLRGVNRPAIGRALSVDNPQGCAMLCWTWVRMSRADADDLLALCVDGDILMPVNGYGYRTPRIGLLNVVPKNTKAGRAERSPRIGFATLRMSGLLISSFVEGGDIGQCADVIARRIYCNIRDQDWRKGTAHACRVRSTPSVQKTRSGPVAASLFALQLAAPRQQTLDRET